MDEIRLGTIGSGMIVRAILDHVQVTEGIRLAAVYSRNREKGEALAARYGAKKVYTDMDAFLKDEEVNFVYIASPNILHYEQTKKALLAGKNVILEKPFTPKLEEAKELVALAKEKGLLLIDAVPTAFLPNFEILKSQLHKVGRIRTVSANYSQYSSRYDQLLAGQITNVFDPAFAGGCLMDINFYNVYLNVALFGKPDSAVYYPNIYPGLVDTSGTVVMCYDGFVSQNAAAKDARGINFFQINGEEGYLYIRDGANGIAEVRVVTKTEDETFNEQPNPDRWFYEVQNMSKCILKGDQDIFRKGLDTMLTVIEIMENVRKAAGILYPGD